MAGGLSSLTSQRKPRLRRCARYATLLILVAFGIGCRVTRTGRATNAPAPPAPASRALDLAPLKRFAADVQAGDYGNVNHFVVLHRGRAVADRHYERDYGQIARGRKSYGAFGPGAEPDAEILPDYNYFDPEQHPYYDGREVHTLQSVTKSVGSALIGIAIGRGEIEGVDAPLLSFLKDHDLSGVDPRLQKATLEDLLTMRTGIEFHETDRPQGPDNTCSQIERSQDWIQFTLDLPMDADPGQKWAYNSGGSQLMSGVIHQATGEYADAYAAKHLFGPLGIKEWYWKKTPSGYPDTLGGLYLGTADLAKLGQLYLQDGVWRGRRILPKGWVAASTRLHVERVLRYRGYGYQWWRADRTGVTVWAGLGYGGQYLVVLPERELVGVVNSWNVFGRRTRPVLDGFLDALIAASD